MRIDVITIFPQYLEPLSLSLVGKAIDRGDVELHIHDLRDHTHDRHRTVDDTPFGGGPGMVMKAQPWGEAIDEILASAPKQGAGSPVLVVPTPSGIPFSQKMAASFAEAEWLIIACGRYEGIDSRVFEHYGEQIEVVEVSIGDYVLAGGEVAALVIAEATIRLIPGVLGNVDSAADDSFAPNRAGGALEGPVFTKPQSWRGLEVPDVLLSGDHGAIAKWRADESIRRTSQRRPDLS
jgi:tRNA (guanine37-N1)-methyltransferase